MKIVITGGAGFVGSNVALGLKKKYPSYEVVAFDNLKRRGSEFNLSEFAKSQIKFIHGDIRNTEDLSQLDEFDVMVDASAEPSVLTGLSGNPSQIINNNLIGTINCLNLCVKHQADFIFPSTSRVYPVERIEGANFIEKETRFDLSDSQEEVGISKEGISEKFNLDGYRSFYGTTKLSCEYLVQEYIQFYGLRAAITRFGVIAGPKQMGKVDQGVSTLWMARHYWKNSLNYIGYGGKGKQVRDILHVADVIDLIDLQIHNIETFNGKIYNAGGGLSNSLSLLEMTKICSEITGNKIEINPVLEQRPADLRIYVTDHSKLTQEVGWTPKKNLTDIFDEIYQWIHANSDALKPILNPI